MINNNKSQLFQCKCFVCVSQFVLRGADQTSLHIKNKKRKKKRRERKEIKTCQIMLCTTNNGEGWRKAGAPLLPTLTQEEASEILGGVMSGVELEGS